MNKHIPFSALPQILYPASDIARIRLKLHTLGEVRFNNKFLIM